MSSQPTCSRCNVWICRQSSCFEFNTYMDEASLFGKVPSKVKGQCHLPYTSCIWTILPYMAAQRSKVNSKVKCHLPYMDYSSIVGIQRSNVTFGSEPPLNYTTGESNASINASFAMSSMTSDVAEGYARAVISLMSLASLTKHTRRLGIVYDGAT